MVPGGTTSKTKLDEGLDKDFFLTYVDHFWRIFSTLLDCTYSSNRFHTGHRFKGRLWDAGVLRDIGGDKSSEER